MLVVLVFVFLVMFMLVMFSFLVSWRAMREFGRMKRDLGGDVSAMQRRQYFQ